MPKTRKAQTYGMQKNVSDQLSMVAHLVQNSCFCIQRKILIFRETSSYSEQILLYSEKHFHIQGSFIFSEFLCILKNFMLKEILLCSVNFLLYSDKFFIFRKKMLYLKKLFIFRENLYVQRKCLYSEKC